MFLAHPEWLIALVLLPVLAAVALICARSQARRWGGFAARRLRASLVRRSSSIPGWLALGFLAAATALIIAAISRPQAISGMSKETTVGRNLLIALDLSRSMSVADVKPDRLSQAKLVIHELLDTLPGERIGLIGFAGSAYLYAPLTIDHAAVRETVDQIDVNWPTIGGSNLAEAIDLGIETLRKTGQKNNALVVISDGEKHDGSLDEIITEARESGIFILTIGVGTENGDFVPSADSPNGRMLDRNGNPVISRLQPEALQRLAVETQGAYATAGSGTDIAEMVRSAASRLDSFEMEGKERLEMIEFYQWLVLPAIVFLMASMAFGTRWKLARVAVTCAAVTCLLPGRASADLAADARQALDQGDNGTAAGLYQMLAERSRITSIRARYRLGEALAAYRHHDYERASEAYSRALVDAAGELKQTAHLGMGNTLFQLGWSVLSPSPYASQGSGTPDLAAFDAMVRSHLKALRSGDDGHGHERLAGLITNWADAIRHHGSVTAASRQHPLASHNRQIVLVYLKRLAELLDEEKNETEMMIPPPMPEDPQQGDKGKDEPKEQKEGGEPQPDEQGDNGSENENQQPQQGQNPKQEPKEPQGDDKDKDGDDSTRPKETPEQRARRILKENADLEKGPLTPGYREFNQPEKDW